jgi:glycerol-3-phosphate dehydrogenase
VEKHIEFDPVCWTATKPLPGGDLLGLSFDAFLQLNKTRYAFLPEKMCYRLTRAYGSRIEYIVGTATTLVALGRCFGADLYEAEVNYLCRYEFALCSEDILWRRSKIGLQFTPEETMHLTKYLEALCKPQP